MIRVCVVKDVGVVTVKLEGSYHIYAVSGNQVIKSGKGSFRVAALFGSDGLLLGTTPVSQEHIRIVAEGDTSIGVNGRTFRGGVEISRTREGTLTVVNDLNIDEYLYGVLYHEVSHHWPYEILKAQAIIARTYALCQKESMRGKPYDMTADIYSQVYGGSTSEQVRTNKAVDLTRGEVLTYDGKIFPTYYHATCGGFTEDAANLWKTDLPPLKGVACGFCTRSKHFSWTRQIALRDIEDALQQAGCKVDGVYAIAIESRNRSHRINNLIITGKSGSVVVPGKDFRIAIGPNLLRSNDYDVIVSGESATFKGHGWGHGVGLCQWGAFFMACKGWKAEKILEYYYPGAVIKKL
ncbi:MAG: SpoIID/LytB domain-containing protein [Candidatus Omnitrophota bacterium]